MEKLANLNQPIEKFRNVGSAYLKKLNRLEINTLKDLFFHFPHRYEDFSNLKNICDIKIGEQVTIQGIVKEINTRRSFRKRIFITEALIQDDTGTIRAIWFNQPYLDETLSSETPVSLASKVRTSKDGLILSSPIYERLTGKELKHTKGLIPIYPETEGVSSRWLRFIIHPLLKKYINNFQEFVPETILKNNLLPEIKTALLNIHFPKNTKQAEEAKKRFAFEQLFLIQLIMQSQKQKLSQAKSTKLLPQKEYIEEFKKNLSFSFTNDQKNSLRDILEDIQKEAPMSRLLEGEVGCGKTVVAALTAFITSKNCSQTALMAPTGILAEQHFSEISNLSGKTIKIGLLTSEKSLIYENGKKEKIKPNELIKKVETSNIDILIGTHSLIQDRIKFQNLGLVIIDEQHRFGVEQRSHLCKKSKLVPHLLLMTATPIPRTLALALYGDLSISQIKELPKGRKKIETKIVPPKQRQQIYAFIKKEVKAGRQAFIICPLIDESEKIQVTAAIKEFERLQKKVFPSLKLGLLHGRMKPEEKEKIMRSFKEKGVDILVSTPVVEVGIDVPNASIMVIEGAERFGLSQLYQFKGRVGRGEHKSYCFLFSESGGKTSWSRLKVIEKAKDAFELSEKDLKIRGAGDFVGKRQSGLPDLAMASLTNVELIQNAKKEAEKILLEDPDLKNNLLLKNKIEEFKKEIFLQ
jgi:ATP-dependent DNA helicase RecG